MSRLEECLEILTEISQNPGKQLAKYKAQGKQVVGCFAPYTPRELVRAAGMVPMGIWGAQIEAYQVKKYLPAFCCPIMQTSLELGLNGTLSDLSAVLIPVLCDALRCITQNWKVGVPGVPAIPITYPQNRTRAGMTFLANEYRIVAEQLEQISGNRITDEILAASIAQSNRQSMLMMKFCEAANAHLGIITPAVRHAVMKSAWFMECEEHADILSDIINELGKLPIHKWNGKKVVLTGILAEPAQVFQIMAEHGIAVVGDDLASESRQYRTAVPAGDDFFQCLAEQWGNRYCSLIHDLSKTRIIKIKEMVNKEHADGVIACMMKFCDPEEYDFPLLQKAMAENGTFVLHLEIDQQAESVEQIRTRIQTFSELINE